LLAQQAPLLSHLVLARLAERVALHGKLHASSVLPCPVFTHGVFTPWRREAKRKALTAFKDLEGEVSIEEEPNVQGAQRKRKKV
jgi:hypothetical protein